MGINRFFERVAQHYNTKLPFVIYRKPNKTSIHGLLQNNNTLHRLTTFTEQGFVFSPFDAIENALIIPLDISEKIAVDIFNLDKEKPSLVNLFNKDDIAEKKNMHIALVKKGIKTIKENVFKKVVLSRKENVELNNENPISIFKKLLANYKSAFVYCWYHPKVGLWLGATPETLIKIEDRRFSIMALAGTQSYKGTLDVVWENKEQQEQKLVTDFIIHQVAPFVDAIKVTETETVKAGNLLHLKTMISARLKEKTTNLKDIISVLHPTPAVCGLPKQVAKQFILENENYNREFYSGFLGELNLETIAAPRTGRRNIENRAYSSLRKSTQLYVNLRCMQLQDNIASIYVGGGITETSNPEKEWEETVNKALTIKNVLY